MINGRTYYDILGLDKYGVLENGEKVSQESIQRRYYTLKYGSIYEERLPSWLLGPVEEAYRVLSDIELRNEYDRQLASGSIVNTSVGAGTPNPVQEVPTQEEPTQEEPTQEAPVQEEPAQETPVQEVPTQETPVQEVPVQEVPAQETPVQEEPAQETPVQEEPAQEVPAQETSVQEEPAQETPAQETPVQETPVQETPKYKLSQDEIEKTKQEAEKRESIRAANRKQIKQNALIIAGSTIVFPVIGGIAAALILKEKGKFKLQKIESKGLMEEIQTQESRFIDEENKKLEKSIDDLLNSSLSNNQNRYELEIAKLKYQNQIDLLQKRIDFQKSQMDILGYKANNRLHLLALELTLKTSIKNLESRKKREESKMQLLNSYEAKPDRLVKLNQQIEDINEDLKQENLKTSIKNRKTIKLNKLNQRRIDLIEKMKLDPDGICRKQLAFAFIKNKINNLITEPLEEIQEENVRTR